jgi:hypothetical protein
MLRNALSMLVVLLALSSPTLADDSVRANLGKTAPDSPCELLNAIWAPTALSMWRMA